MQTNHTPAIIPLKYDRMFRRIFGSPGSEDILRHFLSAVMECDIGKIEEVSVPDSVQGGIALKDPILKDGLSDKEVEFDVLARTDTGELVEIEIQLQNSIHFKPRLLFNLSRLYCSQIKKGQDYSLLKRSVLIAITDFNLTESDSYTNHIRLCYDLNTKGVMPKIFSDMISAYTIELTKLTDSDQDTLANWARLIKAETIAEVDSLRNKDQSIREAIDKMWTLTKEEQQYWLEEYTERTRRDRADRLLGDYDQEQRNQKALKEAVAKTRVQSLAEGSMQEQRKIAKSMLASGIPPELVMQCTGLSEQEVARLR
jgi:predicted transposase/invertase (TIGR01784 family)